MLFISFDILGQKKLEQCQLDHLKEKKSMTTMIT